MRLDRWFKRRLPTLSLSHLNKIVRTGQVRVDGARVEDIDAARRRPENPRAAGRVAPPAPKPAVNSEADRRAIRDMILYEDQGPDGPQQALGLAVQGGSGTKCHIDGMLASLANEKGERPVLVHRLDRDTSGVLLVAKSRRIAAKLGEIFRSRQAKKIYWALVEGVPKPAQGRISLFLAKGEGMGDARGRARKRTRSAARSRENAHRQTWR